MVKNQNREVPYGRSVGTSGLSRRSIFTALAGALGLSSCHAASDLQAPQDASTLVLRLSAPGSVDLNSTAEQAIDIPHRSGARPAMAAVVLVDVIQDNTSVDTRALRWAAGYPVYDEAASTDAAARVLVKFATPAGTPGTGRARIMFATRE